MSSRPNKRRRLAHTVVTALAVSSVLVGGVAAAGGEDCIPSGIGTEEKINALFRNGGPKVTVTLCPLSVHQLHSAIVFTAPDQVLTTQGDPTDWTRAMLLVTGKEQSVAVRADCKQCQRAIIKSLTIDGNRPEMLRMDGGEALVEMGNSEDQTVKDCRILEPRGWSALHYREGDDKQCTGGIIRNNEIGPAGEEWDEDYDGLEKQGAKWGNPRADGISLACKNSIVDGNTVYDATDGAIVLFGSAGSEIKNNRVISRTRMIMGGINLVDIDPWEGDYTNTRVHHNTISAFGAYIKGGINIGMACWTDDTDSIVQGGTVTDNLIEGDHIGYGFTVASAKRFTVLRNKSTAKYSGFKGRNCPTAPENADPGPFVLNRGSSEGKFQTDFVNGEVQHAICIDPPTKDGKRYKAWRFRDGAAAMSLQASKKLTADLASIGGPVDPQVADHLVVFQQEVLNAMEAVSGKIGDTSKKSAAEEKNAKRRGLKRGRDSRGNAGGGSTSPFTAALSDLSTRLANLEMERKQLRSMFETMQGELSIHNLKFTRWKRDQGSLLERLTVKAKTYIQTVSSGIVAPKNASAPDPDASAVASVASAMSTTWTVVLCFLLVEGMIFAFCLNRRRATRRRRDMKSILRSPSAAFSRSPTMRNGAFLDRPLEKHEDERAQYGMGDMSYSNGASAIIGLGINGSPIKRDNSIGKHRRRGISVSLGNGNANGHFINGDI